MAFRIFSGINDRVVSVQTDLTGTFEVVPQQPAQARAVNLNFVDVHVAGGGITQSPRVTDFVNGQRFRVELEGSSVRVQPV